MSDNSTRNTIWMYSGEKPYIDLRFKYLQLFIDFDMLIFYTPVPGKDWNFTSVIYEQENSNTDFHVEPWNRFFNTFILDEDTNEQILVGELSLTNDDLIGNRFRYHDIRTKSDIELIISDEEAIQLCKLIDDMMNRVLKDNIQSEIKNDLYTETTFWLSNTTKEYKVAYRGLQRGDERII